MTIPYTRLRVFTEDFEAGHKVSTASYTYYEDADAIDLQTICNNFHKWEIEKLADKNEIVFEDLDTITLQLIDYTKDDDYLNCEKKMAQWNSLREAGLVGQGAYFETDTANIYEPYPILTSSEIIEHVNYCYEEISLRHGDPETIMFYTWDVWTYRLSIEYIALEEEEEEQD